MKPRSPLTLARRWTAGALLAATLGAGAVGLHLAGEQTTTGAAGSTSSSSSSSTSSTSSSDDTSSSDSQSSFGTVSSVGAGSGSVQASTSGS